MATASDGAQPASGAEGWLHARLIPTYGIRSQDEQEKRATSCLLAVMHGVPEFGHALLRELGAPKSPSIDTFAEVRFKNADGKVDIPDGAIVCERGAKRWTCLVEVKTGSATLKEEDDLDELWPDLAKARDTVSQETGIPAKSDEAYRQAVAVVASPPEFFTRIVSRVKEIV